MRQFQIHFMKPLKLWIRRKPCLVIYLRIVVQVRINILEESAMGVFKVEIYISDKNSHFWFQLWPVPLNAVVEESIGHQVGDDGELVQRDVPPHPARVLVQDEIGQCPVLVRCWQRLLLRKANAERSFFIEETNWLLFCEISNMKIKTMYRCLFCTHQGPNQKIIWQKENVEEGLL